MEAAVGIAEEMNPNPNPSPNPNPNPEQVGVAEEMGCGLVAADQEIDVTCARLAQLGKQTAMQLATPAGWLG